MQDVDADLLFQENLFYFISVPHRKRCVAQFREVPFLDNISPHKQVWFITGLNQSQVKPTQRKQHMDLHHSSRKRTFSKTFQPQNMPHSMESFTPNNSQTEDYCITLALDVMPQVMSLEVSIMPYLVSYIESISCLLMYFEVHSFVAFMCQIF